jgi:valyl-tRNA synthetase
VVFYPENYKAIMLHWLTNIQDWNVSRQVVWGIPIPVKVCFSCDAGVVDIEDIFTTCKKCGGQMEKSRDTFDTWFSSGQWPFASLGFPDSADFKNFYPTQVMETAGEIIFFWVARMIMFGLYRTGQLPFKTVYLHGIVTARDGKKMSKSRGNVISPLELTAKYGTDALRMALIIGNTPGTSTALYEDKIKAYKLFANKLWNITRFTLTSIEGYDTKSMPTLTTEDAAWLVTLEQKMREITHEIDEYRFYIAGEKLYHYVWQDFADIFIEQTKPRLFEEGGDGKASAQYTIHKTLQTCIAALHPFMPFITEEIWGSISEGNTPLLVTPWPVPAQQ